jgi:hypothetical protein
MPRRPKLSDLASITAELEGLSLNKSKAKSGKEMLACQHKDGLRAVLELILGDFLVKVGGEKDELRHLRVMFIKSNKPVVVEVLDHMILQTPSEFERKQAELEKGIIEVEWDEDGQPSN